MSTSKEKIMDYLLLIWSSDDATEKSFKDFEEYVELKNVENVYFFKKKDLLYPKVIEDAVGSIAINIARKYNCKKTIFIDLSTLIDRLNKEFNDEGNFNKGIIPWWTRQAITKAITSTTKEDLKS